MQIIIKNTFGIWARHFYLYWWVYSHTKQTHLYVTKRLSYHEVNVSLFTAEVIHQSLEAMLLFANLKHTRWSKTKIFFSGLKSRTKTLFRCRQTRDPRKDVLIECQSGTLGKYYLYLSPKINHTTCFFVHGTLQIIYLLIKKKKSCLWSKPQCWGVHEVCSKINEANGFIMLCCGHNKYLINCCFHWCVTALSTKA